MQNSVKDSFLDGLGNGIGYGSILIIVKNLQDSTIFLWFNFSKVS